MRPTVRRTRRCMPSGGFVRTCAAPARHRRDGGRCGPHTTALSLGSLLTLTLAALQPHAPACAQRAPLPALPRRLRSSGTGDGAGPTRRLEAWPCTERRRGRHRAQRCAGSTRRSREKGRRRGRHRAQRCAGSTHRSRVGGRRRGRHRVQRCAGSTRHSLERGRRRGRHRAQRCAGSTHRSRVGGCGGAAATGFNGGFIGHRDEREKQPSGGMRGERWRFSPAGGGRGDELPPGGVNRPPLLTTQLFQRGPCSSSIYGSSFSPPAGGRWFSEPWRNRPFRRVTSAALDFSADSARAKPALFSRHLAHGAVFGASQKPLWRSHILSRPPTRQRGFFGRSMRLCTGIRPSASSRNRGIPVRSALN